MSTAHHLSVADVRRRLAGNRVVVGASEIPLGKVVWDLYKDSYKGIVQ
jgi:hypothetical protein